MSYNNFSNRGQKFKLNVYQKPDESNGNTEFEAAGANGDDTPVIGIAMSVVIVILLLGVGLLKREDITNCISKTRQKVKLNTASRV